MVEKNKENCINSHNCYAVTALCIAFLTLGLLIGNWVGKCQKATKDYKAKNCKSYSVDGTAGSTCSWSKNELKYIEGGRKDSTKKK